MGPNLDRALRDLECVLTEYRQEELVSPHLIAPDPGLSTSRAAGRRKSALSTGAAVGALCLAGVLYAVAQDAAILRAQFDRHHNMVVTEVVLDDRHHVSDHIIDVYDNKLWRRFLSVGPKPGDNTGHPPSGCHQA